MILSLILFCIFVYLFQLNSKNYFKKKGLQSPRSDFLFGHCLTLWSINDLSEQLRRWTRMYGSIYGLFQGKRPIYVVSNVEFLNKVYLKEFSSFNIRSVPLLMKENQKHEIHLFGSDGFVWQKQKQILSQLFSNFNLKLMTNKIQYSIEIFSKKLNQFQQSEFDIYPEFQMFAMNTICDCSFSMNNEIENDFVNILMNKCQLAIIENPERLFLTKLGQIFGSIERIYPFLMSIQILITKIICFLFPSYFLNKIEQIPAVWLLNQLKLIVKQRKTCQNSNKIDWLQLMLNSNDKSKKLYDEEIIANLLLFLIAGHDSVSTALASATYILATNQQIQEKLRSEIAKQSWTNENQFDIDLIVQIKYLDFFVKEVLRMYPIALSAIKRECCSTISIQGIEIEKGSIIYPDVLSIHNDIDLWGPDDPNVFLPERHQIKRDPLSFLSFGAGPRTCLGMRFALIQIKMCLCYLIRHFSILPGQQIQQGFQHIETYLIQPKAVFIQLNKL